MLMMPRVFLRILIVLSLFIMTQLKAAPSANWVQMNPVTSQPNVPSPREDAAMAFDPISERIILFGGIEDNGFNFFNDTWAYDVGTNTWTDLTPSPLPVSYPDARSGASMAYDPTTQQIIMFGGIGNFSGGVTDETWAYDGANNTWINKTPSTPPASYPPAREHACMAFDESSNQMIMYGGDTGGTLGREDVWGYNASNNTWILKANSNIFRTQAMMAYNPAIGRVIMFGGRNGVIIHNSTFSFVTATNSWTSATTTSTPSARFAGNMVLDSRTNLPILFGGASATQLFNDTWAFDSSSGGWQQLLPNAPSSSPPARYMASMGFNSIRGRTILFGGATSFSTPADVNDTWSLVVNGTAPQITSANEATFSVGIFTSFTVTTTGSPAPSILESGALPAGINFVDNGDGTATLSGTPAVGTTGNYPIIFTVSNGVPPDAVQNFTLIVEQAPTFTSPNNATFTVGTPSSFTITTTGFPTATTISESGALPADITFTNNGNGTATLSGTPVVGTGGTYPLTLTASNGIPPNAQQAFTLTVQQAPAITSPNNATFTVGTPSSFTITTTGFPTATTISESGTLPAGITFTNNGNGTATLSGTPAVGTQGSYPLTIIASNGIPPNAQQVFTLNVNVGLPSISITVTASTLFAAINQPVTLTAVVAPSSAPAETVTFFDDLHPLGTVPLNQGSATLVTSLNLAGSHVIYAVYNGNPPVTSLAITVVVERPLSPQNVQGFQKGSKKNLVNVITWHAPVGGVPIARYRIYRDADLQKLIGEVPSNQPLIFKDPHRKPCKTYTYSIVSVDQFGNQSAPVSIKIKGKRHCH